MDRLRKHRKFLQNLLLHREHKDKVKKSVKEASKGELCVICEVIKNLVHNREIGEQLSEEQREQLRKHRKQIQKLINHQVSSKKKKGILQRGAGGFHLPLILAIAAPIISHLITGSS